MRKILTAMAVVAAAVAVAIQVVGAAVPDDTPQTVSLTNTTINDRVNALVLSGGRLYVAGRMTAPFTRLGAIDPVSGTSLWDANAPSEVRAIVATGGRLYAGGDFGLRIYTKPGIAPDVVTIACGTVRALALDSNGGVVVGGNFTTCGGETHKYLARIDGANPLAIQSSWTAGTGNTVLSLKADSAGGVYVGGNFGTIKGVGSINGVTRYRLGRILNDGTLDTTFNPTFDPPIGDTSTGSKTVRALDLAGNQLYASWGDDVNKVVFYNAITGSQLLPAAYPKGYWASDGDTQALLVDGSHVYAGGHWFQYIGTVNNPAVHFASFKVSDFTKEPVVAPIPVAPFGVFAIISDGAGGLWLGGDVTGQWGPAPGVKVKRLVHLTPGGGGGGGTTTTTTSTTVQPTTTTTTTPGNDTQEPDSKVSSPTPNQAMTSPVTFSGKATDDVSGVAKVRMAVRQASTQLWLQDVNTGAFGTMFKQFDLLPPALTTVGDWAWSGVNLPAGSYFVQSKAVDNSGKVETTTPWVAFTVS